MQVENAQEQEFWYRPRLALEGYVIFRKEKSPEKCEVQDILILNSDGTTSAEPEPKSKSKKKSSKKVSKSSTDNLQKTPSAKISSPPVPSDPNKSLNIARSKKSVLNKDTLDMEDQAKDLINKEGNKVNEAIDLDRSESPPFSKKIGLVEKFTGTQDKSPLTDTSKNPSGQNDKPLIPQSEKKITPVPKAVEKKNTSSIVEPIPMQTASNDKKMMGKHFEEPQNSVSSVTHLRREGFQGTSQDDMTFSCPDNRCSDKFMTPEELFMHMCNVHRLSCKMPYCSFMCYTFQEYSQHFEKIHCLAAPMPMKRPSSYPAQQAHKEFKQSAENSN